MFAQLKCQCVLTASAPILAKIIKKLAQQDPLLLFKDRLHQVEIAVEELKKCAAQHNEFRYEWANAIVDQNKRAAIDPAHDKLQTTQYKIGKAKTRQVIEETRKREAKIESGRMRKKNRRK